MKEEVYFVSVRWSREQNKRPFNSFSDSVFDADKGCIVMSDATRIMEVKALMIKLGYLK